MKLYAQVLAMLTSAALAVGCGADADESVESDLETFIRPDLAQMNDVSILFPLAKSKAGFDSYLTPASIGRGGALLGSPIYERAFGPPGTLLAGGTPAAPKLSGLKLVAVRFDSCFAALSITDEGSCKNQMRLIFQTLVYKNNQTTAVDDAVHVFYSLTRAELKSAVQAMIALRRRLRQNERLGALGPHPLLRTGTGDLNVANAKSINQVVTELAGPANLVQFTQFAVSGLDTTWNFSGFDVATNKAMQIPKLPANDDTHVAFFAGFTPGQLEGDPAFVPASTAPAADNIQALGNRLTAKAASPSSRATAFSALLRLENPSVHSPDTTDCASCHAVEPIRKFVGTKLFAQEFSAATGAFVADRRWVPQVDMAVSSQADPRVNVHMFSYQGTTASVHRRTINETAAIVAHLNSRILNTN
jgi:hypothetical protein